MRGILFVAHRMFVEVQIFSNTFPRIPLFADRIFVEFQFLLTNRSLNQIYFANKLLVEFHSLVTPFCS